MMDLTARRDLEVGLDRLNLSRNPTVLACVARAKTALNNRRWKEADEAYKQALASSSPQLILGDLLVSCGEVQSRAHANRLVAQGRVLVDNRTAVNSNMDVADAKEIHVAGKLVVKISEVREGR